MVLERILSTASKVEQQTHSDSAEFSRAIHENLDTSPSADSTSDTDSNTTRRTSSHIKAEAISAAEIT
jgi:hypothetical protein